MASQNRTAEKSGFDRAATGLPVDLIVVGVFVALAAAVALIPATRFTPLGVVFGLPLLLFVPGYLLLAALFPGLPEDRPSNATRELQSAWSRQEYSVRAYREKGIDGVERAALSFALSLALIPLFGLVLTFLWTIDLVPIVAVIGAYSVGMLLVAGIRRIRTPPGERFTVRSWVADVRARFFAGSGTDTLLNVFLALALLLVMSSAAYAFAVPNQGERFTDFVLLSENDDGELVQSDYPEEFTRGEGQPFTVLVENNEREVTDYSIVVELQRVRTADDGSTTVVERQTVREMDVQTAHGETWTARHSVVPEMTGENLRLTYLLYEGEPPENPTIGNSYRHTYVWIDVYE